MLRAMKGQKNRGLSIALRTEETASTAFCEHVAAVIMMLKLLLLIDDDDDDDDDADVCVLFSKKVISIQFPI